VSRPVVDSLKASKGLVKVSEELFMRADFNQRWREKVEKERDRCFYSCRVPGAKGLISESEEGKEVASWKGRKGR